MDQSVLGVKLGRLADSELGCEVVFDKLNGGDRPDEADGTGETGLVRVPVGVVERDVVRVWGSEPSVELVKKLDVEVKLPDAGTLISVVLAVFTLEAEFLVVGTGSEDALATLVICPGSLRDDPAETVVKLALETGGGEGAVNDVDDAAIEARGL